MEDLRDFNISCESIKLLSKDFCRAQACTFQIIKGTSWRLIFPPSLKVPPTYNITKSYKLNNQTLITRAQQFINCITIKGDGIELIFRADSLSNSDLVAFLFQSKCINLDSETRSTLEKFTGRTQFPESRSCASTNRIEYKTASRSPALTSSTISDNNFMKHSRNLFGDESEEADAAAQERQRRRTASPDQHTIARSNHLRYSSLENVPNTSHTVDPTTSTNKHNGRTSDIPRSSSKLRNNESVEFAFNRGTGALKSLQNPVLRQTNSEKRTLDSSPPSEAHAPSGQPWAGGPGSALIQRMPPLGKYQAGNTAKQVSYAPDDISSGRSSSFVRCQPAPHGSPDMSSYFPTDKKLENMANHAELRTDEAYCGIKKQAGQIPHALSQNSAQSTTGSSICANSTLSMFRSITNRTPSPNESKRSLDIVRRSPAALTLTARDHGFRNLGNTCYMAAVMQALLAQSQFLDDCISSFWSNIINTMYGGQKDLSELAFKANHSSNSGNTVSATERHSTLLYGTAPPGERAVFDLCADDGSVAPTSNLLDILLEGAPPSPPLLDITPATPTEMPSTLPPSRVSCVSDSSSASRTRAIPPDHRSSLLAQFHKICVSIDGMHRRGTAVPEALQLGSLKHALDCTTNLFTGYGQQDADEFFSTLVNGLHDEFEAFLRVHLFRVQCNLEGTTGGSQVSNATPSNALQPLSMLDKPSNDAINGATDVKLTAALHALLPTLRNFHMEVRMCVTCAECKAVSTDRPEYYRELSIDLEASTTHENTPQPLQLSALLAAFFASQHRVFCCETCLKADRSIFRHSNENSKENNANGSAQLNGTSNAKCIVTNRLQVLPNTLVIHLKRFRYDGEKVTTAVKFPLKLQLPADLHADGCTRPDLSAGKDIDASGGGIELDVLTAAQMRESLECDKDQPRSVGRGGQAQRGPALYELSAVVRHLGNNPRSGHYITDLPDNNYCTQHSPSELTSNDSDLGHVFNSLNRSPIGSEKSTLSVEGGVQWRRCDDSTIRAIPLAQVLADQHSPYLLFYRLTN